MTSTKVLVLLCDDNYVDQAKGLFFNAKNVGKWDGDFALIYTGTRNEIVKDFLVRGIHVPFFPQLAYSPSAHFYKYYLFDSYFTKWRHVLYIDLDVLFTSEVDLFKTQTFSGIYSNADDLSLVQQFDCTGYDEFLNTGWDLAATPRFKEIARSLGQSSRRRAFQSCFILFSTDLIKRSTVADLLALHERYYLLANLHTYEQAILNFYFMDVWQPLSARMINVYEHWRERERIYDTGDYAHKICIHFGRWQAPWKCANERFRPIWTANRRGFDSAAFSSSPEASSATVMSFTRRLTLRE